MGATYTSAQCYINLWSLVARETLQYFYKIHWCMVKCILFLKNTTAIMKKLWPWRGVLEWNDLVFSQVKVLQSHHTTSTAFSLYLIVLSISQYNCIHIHHRHVIEQKVKHLGSSSSMHVANANVFFYGHCSKQTLW